MFRGLGTPSAAKPTTVTIIGSRVHIDRGIRDAILIKLADRTAGSLIIEPDPHALPPTQWVAGVCRHVRHRNISRKPFIPMTVVVLFEPGVSHKV
ncbi:hypothetical protein SDC9_169456 [bioreactor metagenome]|uniref:Uncharacterized protein n=1 Tax=bioreactor metagenome TaxID=1076179 RepID=A0A645GE38_9ZZZZ